MSHSLSIVLTVHNKAHYLDDFIWVLRNSQPDAELVIVDDGSVDGGGEICRKYADVFLRTEDIWETKANNVGLNAASGDFVAIAQDDDLMPCPNWMRKCVALMEAQGIDILGGRGEGLSFFKCEGAHLPFKDAMFTLEGDLKVRHTLQVMHPDVAWRSVVRVPNSDPKHDAAIEKAIAERDWAAMSQISWLPRAVTKVDTPVRSPFIARRDYLKDLGFFDEAFAPLGYDDVDLCLRAAKGGGVAATTRVPQISKFRGGSSDLYSSEEKKKIFRDSFGKNLRIVKERYMDFFVERHIHRLMDNNTSVFTP